MNVFRTECGERDHAWLTGDRALFRAGTVAAGVKHGRAGAWVELGRCRTCGQVLSMALESLDPRSPTLWQAWSAYACEGGESRGGARSDVQLAPVLEFLGEMQLGRLGLDDVEAYRRYRTDPGPRGSAWKPPARAQIEGEVAALGRVLLWARRHYLVFPLRSAWVLEGRATV